MVIGDVEEEAGGLITWHTEERAKTSLCVQKKHNLMSFAVLRVKALITVWSAS